MYYSPRPGPGDNWPMAATPAAQVVGYNQISRLTLTADGKSVEPSSERVILRVPKAKIGGSPSGFPGGPTDSGPGHVGGAGLDFDSEGNLYLGVGDDVSPNASGHSGYAPMDYRSAERWDARKTSANTADLRGKVLRIKPTLAPIASDRRPGVGSTYTIPAGNLFPLGTAKTRPEIYAMGFRQPFTLHTDPKNPGMIGVGEYCHDASTDRAAALAGRHVRVEPGQQGRATRAGRSASATSRRRTRPGAGTTPNQTRDGPAVRLLAGRRSRPTSTTRRTGQTAEPADVPGPGHDPEAGPGDDLEEVPERRQRRHAERGGLRRPHRRAACSRSPARSSATTRRRPAPAASRPTTTARG